MSNDQLKVLFCGNHFEAGYHYTKEALSTHPSVNVVNCSLDDLDKEIVDTTVVVPLMAKITSHVIDLGTKLKLIMQYGVGVEGVDINYATEKGIFVSNIPSEGTGNAQACAELCVYLSLDLLRQSKNMYKSIKSGKLGTPCGKTLFKSTAIIYGFGGIGKQLLKRLQGFDMKIHVLTRTIPDGKIENYEENGVIFQTVSQLPYIGKSADLLFLCCSQNQETLGLVDKTFLTYLKHGIILINVARGGLLNYSDVYEAVCSGQLGGLGLDVFNPEPFPLDNELLLHPNVTATPHVAGVTEISYRNMAQKVAEAVLRVQSNRRPEITLN